jgi:hypothetical protein
MPRSSHTTEKNEAVGPQAPTALGNQRRENMTKHQPQATRFGLKPIVGLLLAIVVTATVAAASSAANGNSPAKRGALDVTKECSEYTGQALSFCTITSSNVPALTAGSKVVYLQARGASSLDSDFVIVVGPGKLALGHVTLDRATGTGEVTISGGTGPFKSFHAKADVSPLGGPDFAWDGRYRFG